MTGTPAAPTTATATVRAPAKLTVSLRVTGVRPDGYHLLDAEMVTLDLADVLTFAPGDSLTVSGPAASGVPADDSNLVRRALRAVGRPAAVHIDKHIPAGVPGKVIARTFPDELSSYVRNAPVELYLRSALLFNENDLRM